MAVYTKVEPSKLADFLHAYDLGEVREFVGIAEGVQNTNYLLRTQLGSYIVTLYESEESSQDLSFFLHLMRHLAGHGVVCPVPVGRKDGTLWGVLCQKPACIVSFLPGRSKKTPDLEDCHAVGAIMAKFHHCGKDFNLTRANSLNLTQCGVLMRAHWQEIKDFFATHFAKAVAGESLEDMLPRHYEELQALWPSHLPQGIIHGDLFPDNVLFPTRGAGGMIDFYFACHDFLAYDLAIALNAWCFCEKSVQFNVPAMAAVVAGYESVRPLEAREKEALPLLMRGAALRFFLTRVQDSKSRAAKHLGAAKDPSPFLQRFLACQNITPKDFSVGG